MGGMSIWHWVVILGVILVPVVVALVIVQLQKPKR